MFEIEPYPDTYAERQLPDARATLLAGPGSPVGCGRGGAGGDEEVHRCDRSAGPLKSREQMPIERGEALVGMEDAQGAADLLDRLFFAEGVVGQLGSGMELAERMDADRQLLGLDRVEERRRRTGPFAGLPQQVDQKRCVQMDQSFGALARCARRAATCVSTASKVSSDRATSRSAACKSLPVLPPVKCSLMT